MICVEQLANQWTNKNTKIIQKKNIEEEEMNIEMSSSRMMTISIGSVSGILTGEDVIIKRVNAESRVRARKTESAQYSSLFTSSITFIRFPNSVKSRNRYGFSSILKCSQGFCPLM